MSKSTHPARRGRRQLLLMLAICLTPPLLALALYFVFPQWVPTHRVNHGQLLDPAQPLPAIQFEVAGRSAADASLLHGKWSLIVFGYGERCDASCVERVRLMRNLRQTLRDNASRVQVLYWVKDASLLPAASAVLHPDASLDVVAPTPHQESAIGLFQGKDAPGAIAIVDPLGNWVLSYPPDAPPKAVYEDFKVLLRYSQIG